MMEYVQGDGRFLAIAGADGNGRRRRLAEPGCKPAIRVQRARQPVTIPAIKEGRKSLSCLGKTPITKCDTPSPVAGEGGIPGISNEGPSLRSAISGVGGGCLAGG